MIEVKYLAGLVDGDGCIRLKGSTPELNVTNKDLPLLLDIQETFGGSVRNSRNGAHRWEITGLDAIVLLMWLVKDGGLTAKRVQANIVVRHWHEASPVELTRLETLLKDLKRLNYEKPCAAL